MSEREAEGAASFPPQFALVTTRDGGTITISLAGELDTSRAEQVDAELKKAQADADRVVVDLRDLTFLDSMGLNVLLEARRRDGNQKSDLSFIPSEHEAVTRLLSVIDMEHAFGQQSEGPPA